MFHVYTHSLLKETYTHMKEAYKREWPYISRTAQKVSWNPSGGEPVHWKPADIDPGSINVQIQNYTFSRVGGTNQNRECI